MYCKCRTFHDAKSYCSSNLVIKQQLHNIIPVNTVPILIIVQNLVMKPQPHNIIPVNTVPTLTVVKNLVIKWQLHKI